MNLRFIFIFIFVFLSKPVAAKVIFVSGEDSITYDEANNYYIIRYVGEHDKLNEIIWQSPTNIDVEVKSKYRVTKNGMIEYEYEIEVGDNSRLALGEFHFYALSVDQSTIKTPKAWDIFVRDTYDSNDPTQLVSWATTTKSVQAGDELEGIELKSMALPVYDALYVRGETNNPGFEDYGPKEETHSYFRDEIIARHFEGKAFNTAIPLIPVSETFNAVETYTAFHQSLLHYIKKGYIGTTIAPSLADASSGVLTALMINDVNSALSKLKVVKKLIEGVDKDHNNEKDNSGEGKSKPQPLILKELHKILKFNIKYIKKKLKADLEEG